MSAEASLYDAVHTPRGKGRRTGAVQTVEPIGLTTGLIDEVRRRDPGLDPEQVKSIEVHPGLAVLAERGRTGESPGQGFFDWEPEKRVWPGLAERFPPTDVVPLHDARERLLFAMAVDTARCVEERVLTSIEDADIGSIMGIGFPPLYGGVEQYVDQYAGGSRAS